MINIKSISAYWNEQTLYFSPERGKKKRIESMWNEKFIDHDLNYQQPAQQQKEKQIMIIFTFT